MDIKPKILIVGSTHGHEKIGFNVINELKKLNLNSNFIEFEIGNPLAFSKNIPYIETDLNRSFPGSELGSYEERRAFELMTKISSADLVIDIHSTNTTDLSENSMLIVTTLDAKTQEIIDIIKPSKVLYMKYKNDKALISNAKIGIAFEYGKDSSNEVLQATLFDIANVLVHYNILETNPYSTNKIERETEIFEVYDAYKKEFSGSHILNSNIKNFSLCTAGTLICTTESGEAITSNEDFVPILFGENRYTEILGFKSKKMV